MLYIIFLVSLRNSFYPADINRFQIHTGKVTTWWVKSCMLLRSISLITYLGVTIVSFSVVLSADAVSYVDWVILSSNGGGGGFSLDS